VHDATAQLQTPVTSTPKSQAELPAPKQNAEFDVMLASLFVQIR